MFCYSGGYTPPRRFFMSYCLWPAATAPWTVILSHFPNKAVCRKIISSTLSGLPDLCADYSLYVLRFVSLSTYEAKYHCGTKKWIFQYWETRAWPAKGILILQFCGKGVQVNMTAQFSRRRLENIPEELPVKFVWSNSCENIAFEKKTRRCMPLWLIMNFFLLAEAWAALFFDNLCLQKQFGFICKKLELDAGDLGSNSTCDLGHTSSPLKLIFFHEK